MRTFTSTNIHLHSKGAAALRQSAAFLLSKVFLLVFFFLIIIHPRSGIRFASDGLILWYQTVVPTLLPCMLISSLMVQTNAASGLISLIHPLLGRLLGTSPEGTYCFLIGMLCGYPMGAKTCADMICARRLSLEEGKYLMAFLHFPSPMFVTGYIASANLILPSSVPIFAAVYLPFIPLSLLSRRKHPRSGLSFVPAEKETRARIRLTPSVLDQVITSSSAVMLKIGIYMMIFTILAGFANMLPLPPFLFHLPSEFLLSAFWRSAGNDNRYPDGCPDSAFPHRPGRPHLFCRLLRRFVRGHADPGRPLGKRSDAEALSPLAASPRHICCSLLSYLLHMDLPL